MTSKSFAAFRQRYFANVSTLDLWLAQKLLGSEADALLRARDPEAKAYGAAMRRAQISLHSVTQTMRVQDGLEASFEGQRRRGDNGALLDTIADTLRSLGVAQLAEDEVASAVLNALWINGFNLRSIGEILGDAPAASVAEALRLTREAGLTPCVPVLEAMLDIAEWRAAGREKVPA
jgi:hypothetical protein